MVTCNQSEKNDVMMDKSKYFYEFVKLRVVNVNVNFQKDWLKFHIRPPRKQIFSQWLHITL